MTEEQKEQVQERYIDILDGVGWATDDFIIFYTPELNEEQKRLLMTKLASNKLLFKVGKPNSGHYSPEEVKDILI